MKTEINSAIFRLVMGDIVKQNTEAIVNAANKRLAPGGGVAGAIHRSAGPELWEECKKLGGCDTGEAKITDGYRLKAEHVIHTVGPVYSGSPIDRELLKTCYRNSLELAVDKGINSVSFPAISTGAFRYPVEEAAGVAIEAILDFLKRRDTLSEVRLVLYSTESMRIHKNKFKQIAKRRCLDVKF
ncbi:MAG: macro domain-containing protein [Candidatus Bathyarchaeia archaeon]